MGRGCTMDEWVHFEKLPDEGHVPNSSYWYVVCRHCARAYEQKQLVSAPAKLTGRRSAMRAHLKICPVYGTQYKLEQTALAAAQAQVQAAAAAAAAVASASVSASHGLETPTSASAIAGSGEIEEQAIDRSKRRHDGSSSRGGRGKHCMMEEWQHFIRLQDLGYIGKSNFFQAICKHCQRAYDEAPEDKKASMVPERLVGRREKMRKHLSTCPHFKGELPPLDRRAPPRILAAFSNMRSSGSFGAGLSTSYGLNGAFVSGSLIGDAGNGVGSHHSSNNGTPLSDASTPTGVAGVDASKSSVRLALDEWQFFTRLHRKKDSAYYFARCNFCQQAYESAPEALKSSMEPTIVMGRKSNMQTHLAKCPNIPKDGASIYRPAGLALPMAYNFLNGDDQGPAKRMKLSSTESDSMRFMTCLMEFTIQHQLPFEWLESSSAVNLFKALGAQGCLPLVEEFRGQVLESLFENAIEDELTRLREKSGSVASLGTSLPEQTGTTGSWPVALHVAPSLNSSVKNNSVPRFDIFIQAGRLYALLESVADRQPRDEQDESTPNSDMIAYFHGLEIARWIEVQLQKCTAQAKLVARFVIVPPLMVFQRAVGVLRSRWPKAIFLPDFVLVFERWMGQFLLLPEVKSVVASVQHIAQSELVRVDLGILRTRQDHARFLQNMIALKSSDASSRLGDALESKIHDPDFHRVSALWNGLEDALVACSGGETALSLAEALDHIRDIFSAADGFPRIREEMEAFWASIEQPVFLLAHALHPQLRLKGFATTELTKPSALSDFAVVYFSEVLGRKPSSLRGNVTAYLHESHRSLSREVVAEFAVMDDYFRYLADDFPELSMLMQLLHSVSVTTPAPALYDSTSARVPLIEYKEDEALKLEVLRQFWKVNSVSKSGAVALGSSNGDVDMAMNPSEIDSVDQWVEELKKKHSLYGNETLWQVDASSSAVTDHKHLVEPVGEDDAEDVELVVSASAAAELPLPLPQQEADDLVAFPAQAAQGERGRCVQLRDLLLPVQATI